MESHRDVGDVVCRRSLATADELNRAGCGDGDDTSVGGGDCVAGCGRCAGGGADHAAELEAALEVFVARTGVVDGERGEDHVVPGRRERRAGERVEIDVIDLVSAGRDDRRRPLPGCSLRPSRAGGSGLTLRARRALCTHRPSRPSRADDPLGAARAGSTALAAKLLTGRRAQALDAKRAGLNVCTRERVVLHASAGDESFRRDREPVSAKNKASVEITFA